jgi:hypothetical protein
MSQSNYRSKYSKKNYCPVRCSTDVELDLDVKPKVACREVSRRGTEFDIELDFEVNHHCKLIPKKTFKDECGCVTKCVFGVQLDFDCVPKVRHNPCNKPSAQFELDVELDVSPHCKPIEDCKVRYYKYDNKKSHENHEEDHDHKKDDQKKDDHKKDDHKKDDHKKDDHKRDDDKKDHKKLFDDSFEKSFDKSDIDCDCDVCKPKHKKEEDDCNDKKKDDNKKSYWL